MIGLPSPAEVAAVNVSGSVGMKHDGGKPRPTLIFNHMPEAIHGVIRVLEFGAVKYEEGSWKTVPNGERRYFDASLRHIMELAEHGIDHIDPESGERAIYHLLCDLMFIAQLAHNRRTYQEQSNGE